MSGGQRFTQVDAFTDRPFAGNPAAICVLDEPRPEEWMGQVAREMNLAETAFLVPRGEDFDLRWFTPTMEVDLCGHATLAAAHTLYQDGHRPPDQTIRFHTRSGALTAERRDGMIWLDFPATPTGTADPPPELSDSLGVPFRYSGLTRFDCFVELDSEASVRGLAPDLVRLARLRTRGVIVTAAATRPESGYDFVSRFFAPGSGIPEDPVTGSAHCALAPYWSGRLGRPELTGYQASPRGGTVRTRVAGNRIQLGGHAVTVLRGELLY